MITIYVGNLKFQTTEEELSSLFSQYGDVHNVKLIRDRVTGRPKGFGFVEMDEADGNAAIEALNGIEFGGRTIKVNEAKERREDARPMERRFNGNRRY
ncbi:MAG TPA: RNA-binding protein [Candidatus Kapabacteria bacterium]|nr:RNA-binding protein [Candidatus Kapabacteria bacterium]HPP40148.1 RNA-binding protein [Candidatus Kapabacteria bacterium]